MEINFRLVCKQLWNSNAEKNVCIDCLQELQSAYLFYKKCQKSRQLLSETLRVSPSKKVTASSDNEKTIPFQCCGQSFYNRPRLNKHKQLVHGGIVRFVCRQCPKRFLTKRSLRIHEISHRKAKKSPDLRCDQCQRQFVHLGTFMKHKERHEDTVCYYCNRGFADVNKTKKHIGDGHDKTEKRFSCVQCKKQYESRKILLRHFRTVHSRTIPMFCGQCEESCENRSMLNSHLVECKKKKKSDENDAEYWNIEHLIDDDLGTEWLNYEMLSEDYLDNGEAMVEEFLDDAFEMLAGRSDELKCHHCSTVFTSARDLVMHDITNHGECSTTLCLRFNPKTQSIPQTLRNAIHRIVSRSRVPATNVPDAKRSSLSRVC